MSDALKVDLDDALDALYLARDVLDGVDDAEVIVAAPDASVNSRRELTAKRARVKADLSYASHLLELARVMVDREHQKINRAVKGAERRVS